MRKEILISLGILFAVTILASGCGKQEEKKAEAPPVQKQTVQETTESVKQEVIEKVESAAEETATMTDQAVETAKEVGKQVAEDAMEKLPEEVQQAVDVAKEYSKQTATEEAKTATEGQMPKDTGSSLEQTLKDKAVQEGMKLPGKY